MKLSSKPSHFEFGNDMYNFSGDPRGKLTSWGISWSRMAKVVRNPTCKKSLVNNALSYVVKICAQ